MGWASGSDVANELWKGLKKLIPKEHHAKAAKVIVDALENQDADTLPDESEPLYRLAYPEKMARWDAGLE